MSASDLTPPAAAYSCAPTADSRERMTFSTWATTSGRVSAIIAIRSATSAWISGSMLREHLRGERRVQVGDHERDRLRRLVAQEDDDLLGRRAAQELERAALDRGRQAADDLVRAVLAERAHEHAAGVVDAALGEVVLGEHGLDGLGDDVAADLGRDFWALASSSESASTSDSPRNLKISPARCSPMATSRAAAFWTPLRPDLVVGAASAARGELRCSSA